ncbi:hypothetical protein GWK47_045364 [Chionoecetes opilio]|uniref:Uncharacterized protein n=1 Tax=Chionoecetes opilio TaxID=41210 RepID=A0A8J4YCZ3_CHIOP|nr:hypothetical protein GWK47_045364 [Chionoecetes opilio]
MWTRKHRLTSKELNTLEILVKYCLQVYFKLYYDIKVHHRLEDGPKHIITQLRVMRSQPKKVQTAVTFYVRTGAWFAHSECVLLSLMANQSEDDCRFAVTQILKLRAGEEYGDTSVIPRITPKLNLSATSLQTLISWQPGQVHEPSFTCSLSGDQIQEILVKPYEVPEFSIHTQSTERVVKQVTEAAAAVVGHGPETGSSGLGPTTGAHALLQVTFAPEKTQAMVVSRSPAAGPAVEGRLRFGGVPFPLQEAVKVLGVEVDRKLRSCAASHTRRLDSIQRRALRLVDAADAPAQPEPVSPLDSLEHHRDVAALVVFHKAQVQGVPHLAGLRQPPRIATRSTRTVLTSGDAVEVPRSRASQHQRTFVGRVSRM